MMKTIHIDRCLPVYISGPMSGVKEFNFPAFFAAENTLLSQGFKHVYNPARQTKVKASKRWHDYIIEDVSVLCEGMECPDGTTRPFGLVVHLPHWQNSHGAMIEHCVASKMGIRAMPIGEICG